MRMTCFNTEELCVLPIGHRVFHMAFEDNGAMISLYSNNQLVSRMVEQCAFFQVGTGFLNSI
jgi:hypothetical protein